MLNIRKFCGIFLIFTLVLACNLPVNHPYTGISPILTATAAARLASPISTNDSFNILSAGNKYIYTIQSGDTLSIISTRFSIGVEDLVRQNPTIEQKNLAGTLMGGESLIIPLPATINWNEQVIILDDACFVYGPSEINFNLENYLQSRSGWISNYIDESGGITVSGLQIIRSTAENYSISPKVLLALLEYELHAISSPQVPASFSLGNNEPARKTLGKQLSWAANILNNGYYGWREGKLLEFSDSSGKQIRPNPANTAASVGLMYYFSRFLSGYELNKAISADGFLATYSALYNENGSKKDSEINLIPANLSQPDLTLPLQPGLKWAFTGGPHSGWGTGYPFAAVDFAPPSEIAGCDPSPYWVTALADGVISRVDVGSLTLDLDKDGHSETGWTIRYLHIAMDRTFSVGTSVSKGEYLGHPSCLGGSSSGRNVHIARLYNGEWIPAGGAIPLNLGGWVVSNGEKEYKGYLTKEDKSLSSSSSGEWFSQLPEQDK